MSLSKPICCTPYETEEAYYHAISLGDLETLMDLWADEDTIICVTPEGVRLRGPIAIRNHFKALFELHPNGSVIEKSSIQIFSKPTLAVHSVIEEIIYPESGQRSTRIATNTYLRTHNGWRIIAYHVSMSSPVNQRPTHDSITILH